MQVSEAEFQIIKESLGKWFDDFSVFGSRARGDAGKFSDLDLCYKVEIPKSEIIQIKTRFEESNLPYTVDIVNYNTCSESFQKKIDSEMQGLVK